MNALASGPREAAGGSSALPRPSSPATPPQAATGPHRASRRPLLTRAQLAVVVLTAQGLDNTAIAARRGSAVNTVKAQLWASGGRLGASTRTGIVAAACRAGILDDLPVERRRPKLTPRLLDTLRGLAAGLTDTQIAEHAAAPVGTVKSRVRVLYVELGATGRAHAVFIGWQLRLWDGGEQ